MYENQQSSPRFKCRMPTQILFLINGIASLLGYNALLTSLDYFNFVYKGYDVYSFFLPLVFVGYVLVVISYRWLSYKFSYRTIVTTGFILCNIALIILLFLSLTCKNAKLFGFTMSLVACFLLGLGSNLYQMTFYSEINYLSQSVVSKFTIGTALSGFSITSLRMIIISIAGTSNELTFPIILYFVIAILFNFFTLFNNLTFFRSREYKLKIVPFLHHYRQDVTQAVSVTDRLEQQQQKETKLNETEDGIEQEDMTYFQLLTKTAKAISPYPRIIFFNYIVTFLVFPTLTINKKYENLEFVWSSLIFFFIYNLGDTLGKQICDYRWSFNSRSLIYTFFSRFYFLIAIPLLTTTVLNDDLLADNYIFPYFVQFLFAFTNGMVTNGSFMLSFEKCPLKYKKYAGVLNGIMLQVGILIGTNIAIPFSKIFISTDQ